MKFRKKPVVIDAWRIEFRDDDSDQPDWVKVAMRDSDDGTPPEERLGGIGWCPAGDGLWINTLEGAMQAAMGDMLIRGVAGELYSCRADIFAATYEPA